MGYSACQRGWYAYGVHSLWGSCTRLAAETLEGYYLLGVAKMASHAIFQYNILAIDDTHNIWTNICVKMIIIRLIGPRDEKIQNPEEIRSKGPRQR